MEYCDRASDSFVPNFFESNWKEMVKKKYYTIFSLWHRFLMRVLDSVKTRLK